MALGRCSSCRGFIAKNSRTCPHCGDGVRTVVGAIGAVGSVLAAGVVAVTLMACYGCPDCSSNETYCSSSGTYVYDDASCPTDAGSDRDLPDAFVLGDASIVDSGNSDAADASDLEDADVLDADGG